MTPAMHLNQTETKKMGDKNSIAYKALVKLLQELKQRTGLKFSVIGTDESGRLFEMDISPAHFGKRAYLFD